MANTAVLADACLVKSWIWFTVVPVGTVTDCPALAETPAPLAHLRLGPAGPLPSGSDCTLMEPLDSVIFSACKREPTMAPKATPPAQLSPPGQKAAPPSARTRCAAVPSRAFSLLAALSAVSVRLAMVAHGGSWRPSPVLPTKRSSCLSPAEVWHTLD